MIYKCVCVLTCKRDEVGVQRVTIKNLEKNLVWEQPGYPGCSQGRELFFTILFVFPGFCYPCKITFSQVTASCFSFINF